MPWSGPQFIKARMSEFVAKHMQCMCGYATPSNRFYEFNVTAAAEWSWNASGRSEREFSRAWATRQGLADTLECIERVAAEAGDVADDLRVNDPGRPYRTRRIGAWRTEDFKAGPAQKKTWEVTSFLTGPGRYRMTFIYDSGWYGAAIKCVSLVSTPLNNSAESTQVARDRHEGITGYQPKDTVYELVLREHDSKRRYFVIVDLFGTPPTVPREQKECVGHATMKRVRQ